MVEAIATESTPMGNKVWVCVRAWVRVLRQTAPISVVYCGFNHCVLQYLKNILYRYMTGTETQVSSRCTRPLVCLCSCCQKKLSFTEAIMLLSFLSS